MDLLTAKNLHKSYFNSGKELHVIKGVDISVKKGEILFIVGPSGAGKSTLLHLLAGLDRPDSGDVTLDGTDIYGLSDKKRSNLRNQKIGFVFQFYHLLPEFSALENVMLPGFMRRGGRISELKRKANDILSRVGLEARVNHRPADLSGGEKQRVAIARALINSPEILFCDEPTGNLDSENGRLIYDLILELNEKERITVLVVTHQRDLARTATRTLLIIDGIFANFMV